MINPFASSPKYGTIYGNTKSQAAEGHLPNYIRSFLMIDERRLRLMIRLACYEQKDGKEDLKISKYYRRDYVGFALLKNLFLVTVAYALLLAVIVVYNLDFLVDHLNDLNLRPLLAAVILGYLFVLGIYSVIVYTVSSLRYARAQKSVKAYYGKLDTLAGLYDGKRNRAAGKPARRRAK